MGLCESWATEFGLSAVEYGSAVVIWPGTNFASLAKPSNWNSNAQPSQSPSTLGATIATLKKNESLNLDISCIILL